MAENMNIEHEIKDEVMQDVNALQGLKEEIAEQAPDPVENENENVNATEEGGE